MSKREEKCMKMHGSSFLLLLVRNRKNDKQKEKIED